MLDFTTEYGIRVNQRLESDQIIWLTTVGGDGTPQPRPVWFFWDGTSVHIYSRLNTRKLSHIARSQKVALNLNSDPDAHEVAVLTGVARIDTAPTPADKHAEYLEKYRRGIAGLGMTPEGFANDYSVAITVTPTRMRGL